MNTRYSLAVGIGVLLVSSLVSADDASPPSTQSDLKKGEAIFKANFANSTDREKWPRASFAKWTAAGPDGSMCLAIDVAAAEKPGQHTIALPFDLTAYRGAVLFFECRAKAENVTKPPQAYNGVKYMLHYKSAHGEHWNNQDNVSGTFDWKTLSFSSPIADDAAQGELVLGLQMSTGKVWFDGIRVTVLLPRPPPRPAPNPNAPPAYKGHDLPRLRGVMSPNQFRDEDLRVLGMEWKANLIRWQITRDLGRAGTNRDLDEYDKWFDGKLDELDKALEACNRYGLKLVIDMHSPPGGVYEDLSMAVFYEKKYQDHFVKTWEKIARRYRGHPAVWAYDLINEPVARKPTPEGMDWLETQVRAAKAIRAIDPATTILIEAGNGEGPDAFPWLMPVNVPNVVYQVHVYVPHAFTMQGVSGTPVGVSYPGKIGGQEWNKETLKQVLKPVREFQLAYNVHIYVGEFSAVRWAPGAATYLSDCIDIFEEYGWDWSYHAYREWPGWSVEHENLPANANVHKPATADTDRKKVLLSWFAKNARPPATSAPGDK